MLYPELFKQLEAVRWNMDTDIPWARFHPDQLSEEQAQTIKIGFIFPLTGTPMTGFSVLDAIIPGSAAESPATAI